MMINSRTLWFILPSKLWDFFFGTFFLFFTNGTFFVEQREYHSCIPFCGIILFGWIYLNDRKDSQQNFLRFFLCINGQYFKRLLHQNVWCEMRLFYIKPPNIISSCQPLSWEKLLGLTVIVRRPSTYMFS